VNEKIKTIGIAFIVGLVVGVTSTGIYVFVRGSGRTGSVDGIATANARATAESVERLRDTNTEQRTIIGDLKSENQRLKEHLRSAGGICQSLVGTVETSGAYTASAIEVSKRLRAGVVSLENWYNNVLREYPGIAGLEYGK
jgi:hypothetical protein